MPTEAKCRSCGAAILWVENVATNKTMPVDAEPAEGGNVQVNGEFCCVLKKAEIPACRTPLHKSHFATCKFAAAHRRPKGV